MERININGVWYVREDSIQENRRDNIEIYDYIGCECDTSNYSWEAIRLYKDNSETFYEDISIKFTDKRKKEDDYWDNNNFLKGILENDPESMKALRDSLDDNGVEDFKIFLSVLKEKGWL